MMQEMWKFISKLPVFLSYHDWLINCIYLMHGRITYIDRYIYQYYNSNWATDELCLKTDAHYFRKAGLDTSAVRLQWLIAGFEGAQTFMSKYQGVQMPQNERQALAAYWFSHWYPSFINTSLSRQAPDAKFDAEAIKMAMKWRSTNEMRLDRLLTDIAEYFSLSSPEIAQRYYNFWR